MTDATSEKLAVATAAIMRRVHKARTSREDFVEFVWTDQIGKSIKLAAFQRQWLNRMDASDRLFVEAPRGHGKSTIVSIAMSVYELGRNQNLRIKLVAQSDKKARDRLDEIRKHFNTNPALPLVFPNLRLDPKAEESKSKITVQRSSRSKDASIEATGVTSSATGSRVDLLILDDIVDMRNSIMQPALKELVRQKVLSEWMPLLEPDGRTIVVNTPWTTSDICAYLKEAPGFDLISTPVGTDDDPFEPIWPEVWTRKKLQEQFQIIGPVEYDRAYRCKALSADAVPVQPQWIKYYDAEMLGDPWELFGLASYDLALSVSAKADYFAGVILLYDEKKNLIFVVDAWRGRLSLRDQAEAVVNDAKVWKPNRIVLERAGLQGYLGQYLGEHAGVPLSIWPYTPRGSKGRRLLEIQPLLEDGRIFFHPKLDPTRNPSIIQRGDLVSELLQFPLGSWDDMVDAFVQGVHALRESFPSGTRRQEGFEAGDGVAVRMRMI